jgi:hypothetical protein
VKYISPILSDARNKMGGTVWARNRSGTYSRAKVTPVQPRTPDQQANRSNFAALSAAWKSLDQADIAAWNAASTSEVLHDSMGQAYSPSGFQLYMARNRNLTSAGYSTIDSPLPWYTGPQPGLLTALNATVVGGSLSMSFTITNGEFNDNQTYIIQATPPLSPGINFIGRAIYRNIAAIECDEGTPDFDIATAYTTQFGTPATGKRVGIRVFMVDGQSGRTAPAGVISTIVTT